MFLRMSLIVCVKSILLFGLVIVNEATDRISVAKCNDYKKICSLDVSPINIEGEVAASKEFPFMALLGYERDNELSWPCAGSLISENFVLTAGHCISSKHVTIQYVRLGDLDFNSEDDDSQAHQFNVIDSILHPEYTLMSDYNDIALLKIDRSVEFSQYIQPVCLPQPNTRISDRLIATGWGRTSLTEEKQPSTLQKVQFNLVPHDVCSKTYTPSRKLVNGLSNETQLCAGSNPGERDSCQGFGGGPLLNTGSKSSCLYEIVGITSFGKGCGNGYPGVNTRIASYLDWIESIVWPVK